MAFVELDRSFVALDRRREYRPEEVEGLSLFGARHLKWGDLLATPRVILLAGAASGKSAEFRHRAESIRQGGGLGLYVTIERLEAVGFEASLNLDERDALAAWRRGADPGWFFLDSIDEARINHKDVELALNRFASDLGEAYHRARVFLSCRGSAWTGDADMAIVSGALPVRPVLMREDQKPVDPDEALLARRGPAASAPTAPSLPDVRLVALAPIDQVQRAAFLTAEQAVDIPGFEEALFNQGLETLAERPGDLRTLARYWSRYGRFGTLTEMVEFGVVERVRETNDRRRALATISDDKARSGAERLAAAMTLGQSMDLVLPNAEGIDARSVDPHVVLSDWAPNEVDVLLQRGLFVPSTFGRVRFFHRAAQEYLTARWFWRMRPGLTDAELYRIFLADRFGVRTIPPALRSAAAWLAADHAGLRAQLLEREPLVAMTEGDPGRLPIPARRDLLLAFARKQAAGDVSYRTIDHQALWMFASEELAGAIDEALALNDRPEFRFEMLRLIERGGIRGCMTFVRESALRVETSPYRRIVATRVLAAAGDDEGLAAVAATLFGSRQPIPANLSPSLVVELFPRHLSVGQLLDVIARTTPARRYEIEGFRDELARLYAACPTQDDRSEFIAGLVSLAFAEPLGDWPRLSVRYLTLIMSAGPLARAAILNSDAHGVSPELVGLLRAVGRARDDDREEAQQLRELIKARPALRQALFWAELEAERSFRGTEVRFVQEIGSGGELLWQLDEHDRGWLTAALTRVDAGERALGLDALVRLAFRSDDREAALADLAEAVGQDAGLTVLLAERREAMVRSESEIAQATRRDGYALSQKIREDARRDRLLALRAKVMDEPRALIDPARLAVWPGALPLLELTRWIGASTGGGLSDASMAWKVLEPAFGNEVAENYAKGMKVLWRVTPPVRPIYRKKQRYVNWTTILSAAGLALEAAEEGWADRLDPAEALLAGRHVCLDDQTVPDWLGALLRAHPGIVGPLVVAEIATEWRRGGVTPFLDRAAHGLSLSEPLRSGLLRIVHGPAPGGTACVSLASDLVLRLDLMPEERGSLATVARRRLRAALRSDDWQASLAYLRLLFRLRSDVAVDLLFEMLELEGAKAKGSRAPELLRAIFSRTRGSVVDPAELGAATLGRLADVAYGQTWPARRADQEVDDDAVDFDDPKDALLSALISLDGEEAYRATLGLAGSRAVGRSGHRIRELAREIAERASDRAPWKERDVVEFERRKLAPLSTGEDLLELVCALVDGLDWSFRNADMSMRSVVQTAGDEDAVQEWLGATLQNLSDGRFLCHKEAHVAGAKRPDIVVTATSAPVEVAIELKHDEKGWTLPDLRRALKVQLVEQYLQPTNRRQGLLVISNHRETKFWRDPDARRRIGFSDLISILAREAATMTANSSGAITVAVRGLDAASRPRSASR